MDLMDASREAAEHRARVGGVGWLAERDPVDVDDGVGGDDEAVRDAWRDVGGFGARVGARATSSGEAPGIAPSGNALGTTCTRTPRDRSNSRRRGEAEANETSVSVRIDLISMVNHSRRLRDASTVTTLGRSAFRPGPVGEGAGRRRRSRLIEAIGRRGLVP